MGTKHYPAKKTGNFVKANQVTESTLAGESPASRSDVSSPEINIPAEMNYRGRYPLPVHGNKSFLTRASTETAAQLSSLFALEQRKR
jgi:hypothetical protein